MTLSTAQQLSTLSRIRTKVRRLTASPSESQLKTSEIDNYINTFYLFDVPESIRLFNLRDEFDFYTDPNVDAYPFPRNEFFNIYQPIYIAGYQSFYTQSREQFFRIYPQLEFDQDVARGDGVTTIFSFILNNRPVLRGYTYAPDPTIFSRVFVAFPDATGNSIIARDDGVGGFISEDGTTPIAGTIDYTTGIVTDLDFDGDIPPANSVVNAQYVSYAASRPEALLFYADTFFLRPVPDKAYKVTMEVLKQPTILLADPNADLINPQLEEWWQYLAYGGSLKVLQDRQDNTSIENIMPEFKNQERLALRRTTQQLAQERSATIFTEQVTFPYGNQFNRF
jgi:hypothetical protein